MIFLGDWGVLKPLNTPPKTLFSCRSCIRYWKKKNIYFMPKNTHRNWKLFLGSIVTLVYMLSVSLSVSVNLVAQLIHNQFISMSISQSNFRLIVQSRKGGDIELFITLYPKVYNTVFLFISLTNLGFFIDFLFVGALIDSTSN